MKYKERESLVKELREKANGLNTMADFFEKNPKALALPKPYITVSVQDWVSEYHKQPNGYTDYDKGQDDEATQKLMVKVAKNIGSCDKVYSGDMFTLQKMFGSVKLRYQTSRKAVCRKVVTGTSKVQKRVYVDIPGEFDEVEEVEWICDEPLLASSK